MEIEKVLVFNKNDDAVTLEKRHLNRHQESAQKSKNSEELCCPRCVLFYFMKILMPVANQEVTISRDCAQKKKKK